MKNRIPESTQINEGVHRLVSYTLVSLMLACFMITAIHFTQVFVPDWQPWYLVIVVFLVSVDRLYIHRRYKNLSVVSQEKFTAFLGQWGVILIILKLIVSLSHGVDAFLAEIPLWRRSFMDYFLTTEYLISVLPVILTWMVSGHFADLLDKSGMEQALIQREVLAYAQEEESPPRQRVMTAVFALGCVMVLMTGLLRLDFRALTQFDFDTALLKVPLFSGGGGSTLLFFMLALALFSQMQFIAMNTRWSLQGVSVDRSLASRWALYSIIFLAVLVVLVAILPTSYSIGLFSVLGYLLSLLLSCLSYLITLIVFVIGFLLSIPLSFLGLEFSEYSKVPPPPNIIPEQLVESTNTAAQYPWLDLLRSVLFWGVFLFVVVYALVHYLRQHRELLERLQNIPGFPLLERLLRWITQFFGGINHRVGEFLQSQRQRIQARRAARSEMGLGNYLNLGRLTPRQRIYFFYLALIRRGGESGLAREGSQTPAEYAATLKNKLPDVDQDVEMLTDAFIAARYTRQEVEPERANQVKEFWERIRRALRSLRG